MKKKKQLTLLVTIFIIILILSGCQTTKYITLPLTTAPTRYEIVEIDSHKDLIKAYQKSVMKIEEWEVWYNVQVGSNYFKYEK